MSQLIPTVELVALKQKIGQLKQLGFSPAYTECLELELTEQELKQAEQMLERVNRRSYGSGAGHDLIDNTH